MGLGTAGCTSSKDKPGTFASTVPSTNTATALTKADFIVKMNAVCSAVDQQRKALPTPAGLTDYPVIAQNLSGTLRILPSFISSSTWGMIARAWARVTCRVTLRPYM